MIHINSIIKMVQSRLKFYKFYIKAETNPYFKIKIENNFYIPQNCISLFYNSYVNNVNTKSPSFKIKNNILIKNKKIYTINNNKIINVIYF